MDKYTKIGWVVDAQKDFMDADGALYVKNPNDDSDPGAESIKTTLRDSVATLHETCDVVIYTADWHTLDDAEINTESPDFVNTFPPHCMEGTEGANLIPEVTDEVGLIGFEPIAPDAGPERGKNVAKLFLEGKIFRPDSVKSYVSPLIQKTRFDVFAGNSAVDTFLSHLLAPEAEVFVVGVARDVCVTQAVEGLNQRGYNVVAMPQAMYGLGLEKESVTYERWKNLGVGFYLRS